MDQGRGDSRKRALSYSSLFPLLRGLATHCFALSLLPGCLHAAVYSPLGPSPSLHPPEPSGGFSSGVFQLTVQIFLPRVCPGVCRCYRTEAWGLVAPGLAQPHPVMTHSDFLSGTPLSFLPVQPLGWWSSPFDRNVVMWWLGGGVGCRPGTGLKTGQTKV